MSGFKPQQAVPKRVQKRANVAKAPHKTRKAKMSTKSKEVQAASEALVAHQWGESKLNDAQLQAHVKVVQEAAQGVANQGSKSALTGSLLKAKFSKNPKAAAEAEAQLKAAGFSADDVNAWAAGKTPDADAKFDEEASGVQLGKGVDATRVPLYPALEPFADLETVRKTVEKYNQSFKLSPDASPFGGLGQIIKKYGKLPFAFLALAALTSKGIYMVDPGTLVTFNTSVVIFSYFAVGMFLFSDRFSSAFRLMRIFGCISWSLIFFFKIYFFLSRYIPWAQLLCVIYSHHLSLFLLSFIFPTSFLPFTPIRSFVVLILVIVLLLVAVIASA